MKKNAYVDMTIEVADLLDGMSTGVAGRAFKLACHWKFDRDEEWVEEHRGQLTEEDPQALAVYDALGPVKHAVMR